MALNLRPEAGALYRMNGNSRFPTMETGLTLPNGLGWSPDDRTMYLTNTARPVSLFCRSRLPVPAARFPVLSHRELSSKLLLWLQFSLPDAVNPSSNATLSLYFPAEQGMTAGDRFADD